MTKKRLANLIMDGICYGTAVLAACAVLGIVGFMVHLAFTDFKEFLTHFGMLMIPLTIGIGLWKLLDWCADQMDDVQEFTPEQVLEATLEAFAGK